MSNATLGVNRFGVTQLCSVQLSLATLEWDGVQLNRLERCRAS